MPAAWTLHPQLERDAASLGDLPLSRVLVISDEVEQAQLMAEVTCVARAQREHNFVTPLRRKIWIEG